MTKDSRILVASSTTKGLLFFDVESGEKVGHVKIPSNQTKYTELSYFNEFVLVVSEDKSKSTVRIYRMKDCIPGGEDVQPIVEF